MHILKYLNSFSLENFSKMRLCFWKHQAWCRVSESDVCLRNVKAKIHDSKLLHFHHNPWKWNISCPRIILDWPPYMDQPLKSGDALILGQYGYELRYSRNSFSLDRFNRPSLFGLAAPIDPLFYFFQKRFFFVFLGPQSPVYFSEWPLRKSPPPF